jgi:hypothetical protein
MIIQNFIDNKIKEISKKLPSLVDKSPGSFACGHEMGYKNALLDMERLMTDEFDMCFECSKYKKQIIFEQTCSCDE